MPWQALRYNLNQCNRRQANSRFQVITYDARGFGRSSLPTGPYNHHDDLHALLVGLALVIQLTKYHVAI